MTPYQEASFESIVKEIGQEMNTGGLWRSFRVVFQAGIESAKEAWISVEERLPSKEDYLIIAYDDDIGTEIMKYDNGCFYVWGTNERDDAIDWYPTNNVTHWMPYPKDPK